MARVAQKSAGVIHIEAGSEMMCSYGTCASNCSAAARPPGKIRDAYGCGDSFAAWFTFGLASGGSVQEAADIGAKAGARCLTRAGAP